VQRPRLAKKEPPGSAALDWPAPAGSAGTGVLLTSRFVALASFGRCGLRKPVLGALTVRPAPSGWAAALPVAAAA